MKLEGGCHCGAIRYVLEWPTDAGVIPARRCTCGYCSRFNGTWTSCPSARLEVETNPGSPPRRYRFGTKTAEFLFCCSCGVTLAALCATGDGIKAVLNINTLDESDTLDFERVDSNFEGETVSARIDRRTANWIGNVILRESGRAR